MRKFDKTKNILKANLLNEQRHLESKGLIKEDSIKIGDTVTMGNNFYKVIREPFTITDRGERIKGIDNRSFPTAIRVKNIDTGEESTGLYNQFKKINPEEIDGLKQAKLEKDAAEAAADKIRSDEFMADAKKREAEKAEAEKQRVSSKGDIELAKKIISKLESSDVEFEYYVDSHEGLNIDCSISLGENDKYDIEFYITFYQKGSKYLQDLQLGYSLDIVYITKGNDLVYQGRAEFLGIFDDEIYPWIEDNTDLNQKAEEAYIDWVNQI